MNKAIQHVRKILSTRPDYVRSNIARIKGRIQLFAAFKTPVGFRGTAVVIEEFKKEDGLWLRIVAPFKIPPVSRGTLAILSEVLTKKMWGAKFETLSNTEICANFEQILEDVPSEEVLNRMLNCVLAAAIILDEALSTYLEKDFELGIEGNGNSVHWN